MENLRELTEGTIEFIVNGRTDFEEIRLESLNACEFNSMILNYLKEKMNYVFIDVGGGSGARISAPLYNSDAAKIYIVDPNIQNISANRVVAVGRYFSREMDFLAEEDMDKAKAIN